MIVPPRADPERITLLVHTVTPSTLLEIGRAPDMRLPSEVGSK
jgi:hypothetical protein